MDSFLKFLEENCPGDDAHSGAGETSKPLLERCGMCASIYEAHRNEANLQIEGIKKKCVVGGMPVPGLICLPEKDVVRFMAIDAEHDVLTGRTIRMTDALNKIHDLAGQIGDHPHVGAIQAWVHKILPCEGRQADEPPKSVAIQVCPTCGVLDGGRKCRCGWDKEKQAESGLAERSCCVGAYARGHAAGRASCPYVHA